MVYAISCNGALEFKLFVPTWSIKLFGFAQIIGFT